MFCEKDDLQYTARGKYCKGDIDIDIYRPDDQHGGARWSR